MLTRTVTTMIAIAASAFAVDAAPAQGHPGLGGAVDKRPDLVVSSVSPTSFVITNLGRSDAGAFDVRISSGWLRDPCNRRVPELLTLQGAGLAAGQSVTLSLSSFPSSTPRKASIDFQREVRESNELNNTAVIPPAKIAC